MDRPLCSDRRCTRTECSTHRWGRDSARPDLFFESTLDQPADAPAAEDNGVLLALGTADDDIGCQLRAGEAASTVMLTATVQGLASCAVSEVLEISDTREAVRGGDVFRRRTIPSDNAAGGLGTGERRPPYRRLHDDR